MSKISLIVPVYNSALYLRRCLDSVLGQTEPFDQVVIIDDGSNDSSEIICDEYKAAGFDIYHFPNGGPGAARNNGIALATSEYITFLDSDDRLLPSACASMREAIKTHPDANIIQFEHVRVISGPQPATANSHRAYDIQDGLAGLPHYWFYAWNKLYKREAIKGHKFNDTNFGEDEEFNLELLLRGEKIQCVPMHTVTKYFDNAQSLAHIKKLADLKAQDAYITAMLERYTEPEQKRLIRELLDAHHASNTYKRAGWK